MVLFALGLLVVAEIPRELDRFLGARDDSYSVRAISTSEQLSEWTMVSQHWQGVKWEHTILYAEPAEPIRKNVAILVITGDGPRPGDRVLLSRLVETSRLPVAMLFNVPFQPIEGRKEDDLIAHTFEQYLRTGDASWPLLFPMTRAALRAIDAVTAQTRRSDNPIRRVVVTGGSKRGWTTWFTGVSLDSRVIGIAPAVYDNLDINAQMRKQMADWGKYSPQIEDYTRRGLQQLMETDAGKRLTAMVDPFSYLPRLRAPVLIVNGANDPYWTVDALNLYWDKLPARRWASIVPNAGHGLGDGVQAVNSISAFARACAGVASMPRVSASLVRTSPGGTSVGVRAERRGFLEAVTWVAESDDRWFADDSWKPILTFESAEGERKALPETTSKFRAVFTEFRYNTPLGRFSVTTTVEVLAGP